MQTAELKLEIFRYIDNPDESKLTYNYLISNQKKPRTDFWNTLNNWQKKDIELGIADLENDKKKSFDEFIQQNC